MKEKIEEFPWRSVKIEPGTQKTFDAASHAVFINSQYTLLKEFGEERLHFPEGLMKALAGQVAEAKETAAVVEQALAYLIADRTENFLRGSHSTAEAPIGHKTAVLIRDRARDATKKVARTERERDGRPIR